MSPSRRRPRRRRPAGGDGPDGIRGETGAPAAAPGDAAPAAGGAEQPGEPVEVPKPAPPPGGCPSQNAPAQSSGRRSRQGQRRRQGQRPDRRRRRLRTVDETSAGGLVVDFATSRVALIGRLDRRQRLLWSLPKGHIEEGETAPQTAVREVSEETGIDGVVLAPLGVIDYWFVAEDRRVHKTVHHFLMRAVGGELSDADMEVTEVAWVPLAELETKLAYADERRLARLALPLIPELA